MLFIINHLIFLPFSITRYPFKSAIILYTRTHSNAHFRIIDQRTTSCALMIVILGVDCARACVRARDPAPRSHARLCLCVSGAVSVAKVG